MFIFGRFGETSHFHAPVIEDVVLLELRMDGQAGLMTQSGEWVSVANVLGLVGFGAKAAPEIEAFCNNWRAQIGGEAPPALLVGDREDAQSKVAAWMAGRLAGKAVSLAKSNVDVRRQLTVVRRDMDTLQSAVRRMESFVRETALNPFVSILTCPAGDQRAALTPSTGTVEQRIPVNSFGIAGLDVFVDLDRSDHGAELHLELHGQDTETVYGAWRVLAGALTDGWNTFALPKGVAVSGDALVLRARAQNGVISLSHGGDHPVERMRALQLRSAQSEAEYLPAPIAFRVWEGLPTIPPPSFAHAAPGARKACETRLTVWPTVLQRADVFYEDGEPGEVEDFVQTDITGRLIVQPSDEGPIALVLNRATPREIDALLVTAAAMSDSVEGLEIGLGILPRGAVESGDWAESLTWHPLNFQTPERIVASRSGSPNSDHVVVIAARTEDPMAAWFGTTAILGIEFDVSRHGDRAVELVKEIST